MGIYIVLGLLQTAPGAGQEGFIQQTCLPILAVVVLGTAVLIALLNSSPQRPR